MNQGQREGSFAAVAACSMADDFCPAMGGIIHCLDSAVVDSEVKVSEDALLMASKHPGEVSKSFNPAVGCPECKYRNEGKTDGLFPHAPWNLLHLDTMLRAPNPPGLVVEKNRNSPEAHMPPAAHPEPVFNLTSPPANTTPKPSSLLDIKFHVKMVISELDGNYTMILDSQRGRGRNAGYPAPPAQIRT